jgi:hypothetical protein
LLEQSALVVGDPDPVGTRLLCCPETVAALGFARRDPWPGPPWWRVLVPPVLAVHEQEEQPLVFTVRRAWGLLLRRQVRDADGHPVGGLRGASVESAWGRTVAILRPGENPGERVFRTPQGAELARLTPTPQGLRVTFAAGLDDPFLKMLLLAAALCP